MVIFIVLSVFAIIALFNEEDPATKERSIPIPEFIVETLNGETFSHTDFTGKYHVLHAFASWCVVCIAEHPLFATLEELELPHIYGLAWKDDADKTRSWLQRHGNPYHDVISDPDGTLGVKLGVTGVPETYIIDDSGNIVYRHAVFRVSRFCYHTNRHLLTRI